MSLTLQDNIRLNDYPDMTRRQNHASNLAYIRELSGEMHLWRKMSYLEAFDWLNCYEYYKDEGYPSEMASQYAWDTYFSGRRDMV